jgi:hypothetical protein
MTMPENILSNIKNWHLLTEIPKCDETNSAVDIAIIKSGKGIEKTPVQQSSNPLLTGVSDVLIKLLWDILVYLYSSVNVRIKRLGISARAYEQAKIEGCEKGFITESSAGSTIYLVPPEKTFQAFNMPCPYDRNVSTEHSFFVGLNSFLLSKNACFKNVYPEHKRGKQGRTSDIVTVAHDGTMEAYEVTLNTTNVLANAAKYENTSFVRIIFLCRNYKLREAVKACCREGGLDPNLLAKIDYMHFSQLLRRQRKMSLY